MVTTQLLLVFLSLSCVGAQTPTDFTDHITYDCLPGGTIHIHGVPKEYTVISLAGGSSCHVTQIDAHDYALDRYCTQSVYHNYPDNTYMYQADVQFSHSSSHVVGGSGYNPFRLICDKVHSGGQIFNVETRVSVRERPRYTSIIPTLPYARKVENNRRYDSSPEIFFTRSMYSTPLSIYHEIDTGTLIYLHIRSGKSHYAIRPENCTAAQYNSYNGYRKESIELWDITQDRCVLEPYLMEKFYSIYADQTEVAAPVYSFRFKPSNDYYSGQIKFDCLVRVCSRSSFSCSLNVCDDVRREGRSAEDEDEDDYDHHLVSATLTIQQNASGSVREQFSFTITLLGGLAVMFCRKRLSL